MRARSSGSAETTFAGALAGHGGGARDGALQLAVLPKYPAYGIRAYVLAATGDLDGAREASLAVAAFRREAADRFAFGGDAHAPWTWQQTGLTDEMISVMGTGRRTPWLEAAEAVAAGSWAQAIEIYEHCGSPVSVAFAQLQTGRDADFGPRSTSTAPQARLSTSARPKPGSRRSPRPNA
jgi:hypothetical protein